MRAVLLSGEHPTLPAAELTALLAVHDPAARIHLQGRVALIDGRAEAASRMALAHEWMERWGDDTDDPTGHARLGALVSARASALRRQRAAIAGVRAGHGKSRHRMAVERILGDALAASGHRIDLKAPDLVVGAWLVDGRVYIGRRLGRADRSDFEARRAEARAHFSPVALHPRRARALIHLARVPVGGRIHDPFCGTGTFVVEAALDGYDASGSDLDPFMVQGTLQSLADDGPLPLDGTAFEADIDAAPGLIGEVDGVVTDLPYGRASTTAGEEAKALHERALKAIAAMLRPGGHAVVGAPYDTSPLAQAAGLVPVERHEDYVHKSLTRVFAVVKRPEDA